MSVTERQLRQFLGQGPSIDVHITRVRGSAPREPGAWMLVGTDTAIGTIGGGQLEHLMIDEARHMLRNGADNKEMEIPLGPEIGQCCGGRVTVGLNRVTEPNAVIDNFQQQQNRQPDILIFGAGHVGKALARAVDLLPVNPLVIDQRADALAEITGVPTCHSILPEQQVRTARGGSAIVIVTHDHALDFMIAAEALSRRDFPYVGMIGSATKYSVFRNWMQQRGADSETSRRLICPVGSGRVNDKRPEIIAALVVAEIISVLARRQTETTAIRCEANA